MYERSIDIVFDVALTKVSIGARHLIYILAFLNADGAPEKLFFPEEIGDRFPYLDCQD